MQASGSSASYMPVHAVEYALQIAPLPSSIPPASMFNWITRVKRPK